ncbi:calcineurin-binding protein 1 [Ipomoea triloba]|uniref:calcineurin-binding protein 1 n=1 Tax=Ipomoea triloba TaxID=35885 RepID=UPI00125CF7EB|nr:calcineurin-binding protein 1 [Ipomoea triloba]
MFSISAINDTDSRTKWEPLAPTKEAQEFHLSQTYHEGLLKLQAKEYEKARELLEAVLKDPLIGNAKVDSSSTDGHLLQLRFLALKNLAAVFLQQGSAYYENALQCYLQAVEIDTKDSVLWNQLGTLSCSMGLLSISRWAFEQGLYCSPNNWNCMEKLMEVLVAIGDEVACLSVAELILRHWPSHSRALHVKNTIQESEPIPFSPRGIDKLEPKHIRLKFPEKRKTTESDPDDDVSTKKLKQCMEFHLPEVTFTALADELLKILRPLAECSSELGTGNYRPGDTRISIQLPQMSQKSVDSVESKEPIFSQCSESNFSGDCSSDKGIVSREKETVSCGEQPQERRSSRLERLRSRKPGKEELDFVANKDLAKVVTKFLQPFVVNETGIRDYKGENSCSYQSKTVDESLYFEYNDVMKFIQKTGRNCGAYHLGHLLLEEVAARGILHQDGISRFLDLEKLTRHWGQERTPECYLFLAELYYDVVLCSHDTSTTAGFISETTYNLCKIIESVALDYPFQLNSVDGNENFSAADGFPSNCSSSTLLKDNYPFWVRYFWLSGQLSKLDGDKEKARKEFSISFALLTNEVNKNGSQPVCLPHCKSIRKLTVDGVLHEIHLLEVEFLLKDTINKTIDENMYSECVEILAPLLFSSKDAHLGALYTANQGGGECTSVELSALNVLLKACQQAEPMDIDVYLSCHRRKLQILVASAGGEDSLDSHKMNLSVSETESKESPNNLQCHMFAEEVKAISECISRIKSIMSGNSNVLVQTTILVDIQSLLLKLMCKIANSYLCQRSSVMENSDQSEPRDRCYFIDAAIAFCKLQHLIANVPIKSQTELIVAVHDMLAEFGLCCARGDGEEEEGTFLKFAIKHLLALDMKLKSTSLSPCKESEMHLDQQPSHDNHVKRSDQLSQGNHADSSVNESKLDVLNVEVPQAETDEAKASDENIVQSMHSENTSPDKGSENEKIEVATDKNVGDDPRLKKENHAVECENELTEDEREDLEIGIDNALDQCFYCLYGLNLRSDSSYEDDLAIHKNRSRCDYQTKEQCADVFQYLLPYAKACSKTGLAKLRRVLRAIRKHFTKPPEDILAGNAIDRFLDNPDLCEDKLSEEAGSDDFLDTMTGIIFSDPGGLIQQKESSIHSSEPYLEVYSNLYYLLALSEELSATDKWAGFVLTKDGEDFVQQSANLFKYDLLYNPFRLESWQRLGNIYDEEVDLLLNDGSKQINVLGWRKNATLPERVEASRRRSRRCLLMTLALARTAVQQAEIHELLALVYYDGLQNVVPFYDQRSVVPSKDAAWMMFCQNSMRHFQKAFAHKEDWSHAFYLGKLSEKLGYSHNTSFSYYAKAMALNPSAVDPFYRMHASRLKLLCTCEKQNEEALKVVATYSYNQSTREAVMDILHKVSPKIPEPSLSTEDSSSNACFENNRQVDLHKLEEVWHMLYSDCLSALEVCVEGDLKHFHKARYMLAKGLYRRNGDGDLERAKEELSFCFKSHRSSFTINMWEIDSMVKKGRRKTSGVSGNRRALEVNLAESSRKFITCIRKYILFYLRLLEETRDVSTFDRAYISIRTDKRFSLCLEDLIPVALGRYVMAIISSLHQTIAGSDTTGNSLEHLLEKMFSLFLEQTGLWSDISSLSEIKSPELSESSLFGYLYQYIQLLEQNLKVETLEAMHEKIRKRLKNPKLSNSNFAKVYKYISIAWCQSLVISMALITPLHSRLPSEIQAANQSGNGLEISHMVCVDLQSDELWSSSSENPDHMKNLENKWNASLSKIKNVIIKRAADEDLETASLLLKSSYNFYKDTSCAFLPSGITLYAVPLQLAAETYIQPGIDVVDILDMNTSRKLLLWAYTLLHGHCTSISAVIKYCEEISKSRMRKGTGSPLASTTPPTPASHSGGGKDCSEREASPLSTIVSASSTEPDSAHKISMTSPEVENREAAAAACTPVPEPAGTPSDVACTSASQRGDSRNVSTSCLPEAAGAKDPNITSTDKNP